MPISDIKIIKHEWGKELPKYHADGTCEISENFARLVDVGPRRANAEEITNIPETVNERSPY